MRGHSIFRTRKIIKSYTRSGLEKQLKEDIARGWISISEVKRFDSKFQMLLERKVVNKEKAGVSVG